MKRLYNRYNGNTGRFIRVEDHHGGTHQAHQEQVYGSQARSAPAKLPPVHQQAQLNPVSRQHIPRADPPRLDGKNKSLLGGLGGGLSNLLGGLGGSGGLLGGFGSGLKGLTGIFDHLPFGLDIGDILTFLILLFLFQESGDEEFLIILAVIAFSVYKDAEGIFFRPEG